MRWVTRQDVRVDGVACPWLITRFIDDDAEFGFVAADLVAGVAAREDATAFDSPAAALSPPDGRSAFDALIAAYNLVAPGLDGLARIVRAATHPDQRDGAPEATGLAVIADGIALTEPSDIERQRLLWPVFDALLAVCAARDDPWENG